PSDTVIPDCAPPPDPPAAPTAPALPPPLSPGLPSSPQPAPGPPPTTPAASSAIAITYKPRQRVLKRRAVFVTLSVATPLTVKVRGTITLPGAAGVLGLVGARAHVRPIARGATVRLRVPRHRVRALRRALTVKHRRLYANVQVTASDPAS